MKKLHAILFVSGLLFLGFLLWRTGIRELGRQLALLGWGLVPIILAEGVAEFFHAVSWRHCLSGPHRSLPLSRLFRIHMAGYAINYLTPTASLGGDVAKGALLAGHYRGPEAVSGVVIGKLSFAVSHLLFVVLGSIVVLRHIALPPVLWTLLLAGSALLAAGTVAFLLIQKHGKLGSLVRWLAARNVGHKTLRKLADPISQVDDALKVYYRERPRGLALSVFWHLAGYSAGILSTWYFLWLTVPGPSLALAAAACFLGMWFDLLTFAVPLNVGVLEGSRIVAFRAVGCNGLLGMTFGLALRAAQFFWAAFGLLNYALLISSADPRGRSCRNGETAFDPAGSPDYFKIQREERFNIKNQTSEIVP